MKNWSRDIMYKKKPKRKDWTILVSMFCSLYKNIPQEEGTNIVCEAYEKFYNQYVKHTKSSTTIMHRSQRTTLGKCLA